MMITFITSDSTRSFPPTTTHRPHRFAEAASRLAIESAESGKSVLLLTGVQDRWGTVANIARKPKALRIEHRQQGFGGVNTLVDQFSMGLNNRSSKEWAMGACFRPTVIVNDADYFFAEAKCGRFTQECDKTAVDKVTTLCETLDLHGGQLIVLAALGRDNTGWKNIVKSHGWNSHGLADLFKPERYLSSPNWCHPATSEPPNEYAYGPLEGSQTELAPALFADGQKDFRRVKMRAKSGGIWVRKLHSRLIQVWFRTEAEFNAAQSQLSPSSIVTLR